MPVGTTAPEIRSTAKTAESWISPPTPAPWEARVMMVGVGMIETKTISLGSLHVLIVGALLASPLYAATQR